MNTKPENIAQCGKQNRHIGEDAANGATGALRREALELAAAVIKKYHPANSWAAREIQTIIDANGAIGEREALLADYIELNMSNYGPDDVDRLNAWAIEAYDFISRAALTAEKVAAEPTNIPFSAYRQECCERLMSACTDSGCPDGVNMADWIRQLAASPQATATLSDAALRKLVIGVREFILGYLHSHVKDWPAPYDHLRSDAVTESLVTDARDQIATATQPAQVALTDDARDALRYRWLRDFNVRCKDGVNINPPCEHVHASMYSHAIGAIPAVRLVTGEELDRAIDAALLAAQPVSGGKS